MCCNNWYNNSLATASGLGSIGNGSLNGYIPVTVSYSITPSGNLTMGNTGCSGCGSARGNGCGCGCNSGCGYGSY